MYRHHDVAEKEARTAQPEGGGGGENENENERTRESNAITSGTRRRGKFVKLVRGATQSGRKRGYHFLREEPSAGPTEGWRPLDTAKVDGENV